MFGFRAGRQCLDIVSFLVEGLRKAEEWGEKLFVVSMDQASAFDAMRPELLGEAILSRGGSVLSAAAVVRENLNLFSWACFVRACCIGGWCEAGGSRTPSAWNQLVAPLIDELLLLWSRRGPAVSWAPEWNDFSILVWDDNIFLTTDSAAEAARRSCEVASVSKSQRLFFNESSLEILPSRAAEKDSIPIVLEGGESFSWVETLQLLGCFLWDGTGSTETLAKGRLLQGRKMFNKLRPFLRCRQISLEEQIRGFYSTEGASVLWSAGCCAPSLRVQQLVSVQENRWLRCILGGRKERDMEWVAWLRKTKRAAHSLLVQNEASCAVAQSSGGYSWLGWALGAQQIAPTLVQQWSSGATQNGGNS